MRGIFNVAWLLPAALALPSELASRQSAASSSSSKAIYILNNNAAGNNVVAVPVDSNGMLGQPVLTPTNGTGGVPISTLATPAGIFFSDSSIKRGGNYLFAVNSGSNTVSMFKLSGSDPTHPQLVNTISTGGEFPMSVDYSEHLKQACVLNAGGSGGVACFDVDDTKGLSSNGGVRALDSAFTQSNPPKGPVNTITQIVFNPGSTMLMAVIKGNPASTPISPGIFFVYPINGNTIATTGQMYQVSDIILNFGTSFLSESRFLIAAPTFGGAIVDISNGNFTQTTKLTVPDQKAICWSAYCRELNYGYLYDAGRTTVVVIDVSSGEKVGNIVVQTPGNNGTQGGLYDTTIMGLYSYSLADPDGVVGINLRTGTQTQYLDLSSLGNRTEFEGITSYNG